MRKVANNKRGQSLFEIIIAVAVVTIIIGSATTAIVTSLQSGQQLAGSQKAYAIAQETLNNTRSYLEANWSEVYSTSTKGTSSYFYLDAGVPTATSTTFSLVYGTTTLDIIEAGATTTYTLWFSIEDVERDSDGDVVVSGGIEDPSTQEITAYVTWPVRGDTAQIELSQYVSKLKSDTLMFTNWGGDSGVVGPNTNPSSGDYFNASSVVATGTGSITLP